MTVGRRILIGSIVVTLTLAGLAHGQKKGKPDLTGTWLLDAKKSKDPFGKSIGKSKPLDDKRRVSSVIIIEHIEPKFTATELQRVETLDDAGVVQSKADVTLSKVVYYTDQRGEGNVSRSGHTFLSTAKWVDKDLIVSILLDKEKGKVSIFRFALSKDGKELSIGNLVYQEGYDWTTHTARVTPVGLSGRKVYNKIEQ